MGKFELYHVFFGSWKNKLHTILVSMFIGPNASERKWHSSHGPLIHNFFPTKKKTQSALINVYRSRGRTQTSWRRVPLVPGGETSRLVAAVAWKMAQQFTSDCRTGRNTVSSHSLTLSSHSKFIVRVHCSSSLFKFTVHFHWSLISDQVQYSLSQFTSDWRMGRITAHTSHSLFMLPFQSCSSNLQPMFTDQVHIHIPKS